MAQAPPFRLDDYRGRQHLLLLFAPSARSPAYEKQLEQFEAHEDAFAERDLLGVVLFYEGQSQAGDHAIAEADAQALRARFGVAPDAFLVVLLGKDGTEKARYDAPVRAEVVCEILGAMPMRQREARADG